jgi:hypothetical protein
MILPKVASCDGITGGPLAEASWHPEQVSAQVFACAAEAK